MVVQHLVESGSLAHLVIALSEVGRVVGGVGIEAGREFEISVLFVEIRGDRIAPWDVLVDLSECRQRHTAVPARPRTRWGVGYLWLCRGGHGCRDR